MSVNLDKPAMLQKVLDGFVKFLQPLNLDQHYAHLLKLPYAEKIQHIKSTLVPCESLVLSPDSALLALLIGDKQVDKAKLVQYLKCIIEIAKSEK